MNMSDCLSCGVSQREESICINLQAAPLMRRIPQIEKLKKGSLHRCTTCQKFFYFGTDSFAYAIKEKDLEFMRDWSRRDLSPKLQSLALLKSLAPIVEGDGSLTVPCRCEFKDGFVSEKVILRFTNYPPKIKRAYIRFFDEVKEFSKSAFALSRSIRIASRIQPEQAMGAETFISISCAAGTASLNGPVDFADFETSLTSPVLLIPKLEPDEQSISLYTKNILKYRGTPYFFGFDSAGATTVYADLEDTLYKELGLMP